MLEETSLGLLLLSEGLNSEDRCCRRYMCNNDFASSETAKLLLYLYCSCTAVRTCAFLADIGQVVVAGHIVPLAVLMGNGHHTVLTTCEEVIWLALPPVLKNLQRSSRQRGSATFIFICRFCLDPRPLIC